MQISIPVRPSKNGTTFLKQCWLLLVFISVWGNWDMKAWFKLGLYLQLQGLPVYFHQCCFPGDWAQTVVCVSSDLPAVPSGALTLLRLEKPPVLHSSDSATCDSLCILWAEPSGWLHAAPSHHDYVQPLKDRCRIFVKEGEFVSLGNPTPSIPLSGARARSSVAVGWLTPAASPRTYLTSLVEADVRISEWSCSFTHPLHFSLWNFCSDNLLLCGAFPWIALNFSCVLPSL